MEEISQEEKEKNFENFKKFLSSDLRIKNYLLNLAPTQKDDYNEESRIEYVDRLYKLLRDIEYEILSMGNFFLDNTDMLKQKLAQIRENIIAFNPTTGDIKKLYKQNFSDMNEQLVEGVKDAFAADAYREGKLRKFNSRIENYK